MRTLLWAYRYFDNIATYLELLRGRAESARCLLKTRDGISLLCRDNWWERVDLLKVDCEGGEYEILRTASDETFDRIENIVLEYHDIGDWCCKLNTMRDRLHTQGYSVQLESDRCILAASKTGARVGTGC